MTRVLLAFLLALLLAAPAGAWKSPAAASDPQVCAQAEPAAPDGDPPVEASVPCHDKHGARTEWAAPSLREEDAALRSAPGEKPSGVLPAMVLPPPR